MSNTALLRLETVSGDRMRFSGVFGSGQRGTLDTGPGMVAPSPIEYLLGSVGACEAMDVISILRKKRQVVTGYEAALTGERRTEPPRSFTRIEIVHRFRGHELNAGAVEEAVRLSHERYCSVRASLDP